MKAASVNEKIMSYRQALYQSMHEGLRDSPNVIIQGQGVDDHKGTFGTTLGLADEFGSHRVMDVPLAEESTTGIALGAALNGLYPIHVHIRADFVLLAMNQIVNLVAKYKYMFGGRFEVPMLIRMVVGRSWGQGAQHSQSLQSIFAHFPGLRVIMPASADSIVNAYRYIIQKYKGPVVSLEHRLMYDLKFRGNQSSQALPSAPWTSYKIRVGRDVTVVASSIMVVEAMRAAEHLERVAQIQCEVIDLNCISHPDVDLVLESVKKTGRLVVADTSWKNYGVCAEICRHLCERSPSILKAPVVTLGMQDSPCPTAKSLEDIFYPNLRDLVHALAKVVKQKEDHGIALPDEKSMADVYKQFKGPF